MPLSTGNVIALKSANGFRILNVEFKVAQREIAYIFVATLDGAEVDRANVTISGAAYRNFMRTPRAELATLIGAGEVFADLLMAMIFNDAKQRFAAAANATRTSEPDIPNP